MKKFYLPDTSDKRLEYTKEELENNGFELVNKISNADFVVLGVNPDKKYLDYNVPIFAGNVDAATLGQGSDPCLRRIFDYVKDEEYAIKNAYLTAEAAVCIAVNNSSLSLIGSPVLICGFGRIGKALLRYLEPFTKDITICARSPQARAMASSLGATTTDFDKLSDSKKYNYIFNTVPHPVFCERELKSVSSEALLIDLASFPGGVDINYAKYFNTNLITARGLPGKYSPKTSGIITAKTIERMIKEEKL